MILMNDFVLYHGSRGGIDGEIQPISRIRCDFGKGFYMGEHPEQVKGLVSSDSAPVFYTLKLHLSEIPSNRILTLDGMDWVYAVLANRKKVDDFNKLPLAKSWIEKLKHYDIVIGPIADDRMNEAMKRFENGILTDKGLLACLSAVDYGNQFVAKTKAGCKIIEILSERPISYEEAKEATIYSDLKRQQGRNIVDEMMIKYRNDGLYLDQIIEKYNHKVNQKGEYDV